MSDVQKLVARRAELVQVHDHCPERPYVELKVPENVEKVLSVEFSTVSRDQGWADDKSGASYTWFSTAVQRPSGRSHLRNIIVSFNKPGDPAFFKQQKRWTLESGARRWTWVQALRSGDVIQLIPRAKYLAWVNYIKEAEIKIEYVPKQEQLGLQLEKISLLSGAGYTQRLRTGDKEVRLLQVQPAQSLDAKLKLSWMLASLNEDVKFTALSYVWGDVLDTVEMEIEDPNGLQKKKFHVGSTVERALRQLRHKDAVLRIWIDAVCVNQSDFEERSQQVALMGDIYSRAEKVYIWLGDEENTGIEPCFRLMRNIINYDSKACPGAKACSCLGTGHSMDLETLEKNLNGKRTSYRSMEEIFRLFTAELTRNEADWAGGYGQFQLNVLMSALFSHPWFSRVWVVQEATLAKKAFVHFSDGMISWDEVVQVNEWLQDPAWILERQHIQSQNLMAPIWQLAKATHQDQKASSGAPTSEPTILDIFLSGHDLRATDPRDKLFALLTFGKETSDVQSLPKLIEPNYEKPEAQVFADFTRWWIEEHKSLAILSSVHSQTGRTWQRTSCDMNPNSDTQKMPTWAIYEGGDSRWAKASLQVQFDFKATSTRQPNLKLLETQEPLVLKLAGRRVSKISAIGHVPIEMLYPYNTPLESRGGMQAVIDKIFDPCGFTGFWSSKVIASDSENTVDKGRREYFDHLNAHWKQFGGPDLVSLWPSDFGGVNWILTDQVPKCFVPCFFVAEDGSSGLCPWTAREGDLVALLDGGDVPYLLRNSDSVDGRNLYEFVGECYVEGIMHGEYQRDSEEVFELV
ncbi:unnamed protein product [Clonostachys rosea]|uniref:Heterokaryon incompatibility domain-containing protein n=1 Tax=Bionectria ochroleuca TaxID=29856 RepID=A0ABY6TYK5_BIOOC|nr:unnamed protein product [Clonostachys rosea]